MAFFNPLHTSSENNQARDQGASYTPHAFIQQKSPRRRGSYLILSWTSAASRSLQISSWVTDADRSFKIKKVQFLSIADDMINAAEGQFAGASAMIVCDLFQQQALPAWQKRVCSVRRSHSFEKRTEPVSMERLTVNLKRSIQQTEADLATCAAGEKTMLLALLKDLRAILSKCKCKVPLPISVPQMNPIKRRSSAVLSCISLGPGDQWVERSCDVRVGVGM